MSSALAPRRNSTTTAATTTCLVRCFDALPPLFFLPVLTPYAAVSMAHSSMISGRKRKASEDEDLRLDDRMSASPSNSPNITSRQFTPNRSIKRARSGMVGRPLPLPRLLETLEIHSLRDALRKICEHHPSIGAEVVKSTPRPSVSAALNVLKNYEDTLRSSFPFGGSSASDYAYNRVRQPLMALLEALDDFLPHFLPPNEPQTAQSLGFLDAATEVVHRLPNWESFQNNQHKQNAYDEISSAWAMVLREASKRAGGMQLQYEGWDKKLEKHNQQSNGKLQEAMDELRSILGWMGGQAQPRQQTSRPHDINNVRQELLSGTYGSNVPVRVGP